MREGEREERGGEARTRSGCRERDIVSVDGEGEHLFNYLSLFLVLWESAASKVAPSSSAMMAE